MTSHPRRVFRGFWLVNALMLAVGTGFLAWHFAVSGDADRYRTALSCRDSGRPDCVETERADVRDRTRSFSRSGTRYELELTLPEGATPTVTMLGSNGHDVWDATMPGSTVTVLVWRGTVMQVNAGSGVRSVTDLNPIAETSFTLFYSVALLILGGLGVLVQLAARRRRAGRANGATELDDGPAPGAVGAPPAFTSRGPRSYRAVPSLHSAASRVIFVAGVAGLAALRFDASIPIAALVAGATLPLAGLLVWWYAGYALDLTDATVTVRNRRTQLTVPWRQASVEIRNGRTILRLDNPPGRPRRISLRGFTQYTRSNVGLLRDVAEQIARSQRAGEPHQAPSPAAAAAPAAVGKALRVVAWAIDLVPVLLLWMLVLALSDLLGNELAHRRFEDTVNVAIVPAAFVAIAVYLAVGWRLGATLGMLALRLRLVDASTGGRPTWGQVGRRLLVGLPSTLTVVPFVLIVEASTPWHDRFAGTTVVRRGRKLGEVAASA